MFLGYRLTSNVACLRMLDNIDLSVVDLSMLTVFYSDSATVPKPVHRYLSLFVVQSDQHLFQVFPNVL
jgi:hypothetical protein